MFGRSHRVDKYRQTKPPGRKSNRRRAAGRALMGLLQARTDIARLEPQLDDAQRRLRSNLLLARESGVRVAQLAEVLGISVNRGYQLLDSAQQMLAEDGDEHGK